MLQCLRGPAAPALVIPRALLLSRRSYQTILPPAAFYRPQHDSAPSDRDASPASKPTVLRPAPPGMCLPKRLLLIRHGESVANVERSTYATTPDWRIALTDKGKAQATDCGRRLQRIVKKDKLFIYYSPYKRTRQTLEEIRPFLSPSQILGEREDERLREQEMGNYQPRVQDGSMDKQWRERNRYGRTYYRFPSGESGLDVFDRVGSFFDSLLKEGMNHRTSRHSLLDTSRLGSSFHTSASAASPGSNNAVVGGITSHCMDTSSIGIATVSSTPAAPATADALPYHRYHPTPPSAAVATVAAAAAAKTDSASTVTTTRTSTTIPVTSKLKEGMESTQLQPANAAAKDGSEKTKEPLSSCRRLPPISDIAEQSEIATEKTDSMLSSSSFSSSEETITTMTTFSVTANTDVFGGSSTVSHHLNSHRQTIKAASHAEPFSLPPHGRRLGSGLAAGRCTLSPHAVSAPPPPCWSTERMNMDDEDFSVLIVAHGLLIRLFIGRWFNIPSEKLELLANPPNCSITVLQRDASRKKLNLTPVSKKLFGATFETEL